VNQLEDGNLPDEETAARSAEFEAHLTKALRRVDAPEGFADRVMARALTQDRPKPAPVVVMKPRFQPWIGGAIAAALLAGVFGAEQVQVRRQREQAAMAQQQFEAGIRITDAALEHARDQLEQAGIGVGR
jgi:hypothetical protein